MVQYVLLVELLVGGFLGVFAHEFTHFSVWRLLGRSPRFDLGGMQVVADVGRIRLGDRLAALAPLLLGLPLTGVVIRAGILHPAVLLCVMFYTVGGIWMGGGVGDDVRVALYASGGRNSTSDGIPGRSDSDGKSSTAATRSRYEN